MLIAGRPRPGKASCVMLSVPYDAFFVVPQDGIPLCSKYLFASFQESWVL
jgi:hypothetical protein